MRLFVVEFSNRSSVQFTCCEQDLTPVLTIHNELATSRDRRATTHPCQRDVFSLLYDAIRSCVIIQKDSASVR